tara:strand:+ start:30040 stop:30231 length:192 start_codon:yes stop_codon:yes gene_type:complete
MTTKFKEGDKVHFLDGTTGEIERIKGQSAWIRTKVWSGWKELRDLRASPLTRPTTAKERLKEQ